MVTVYDNDEEISIFATPSVNFYGSVNNLASDGTTEKVRARLKWHYMNAYEKYKAGGRKPWKLLVQIFKIVLVTTQVYWFSTQRFSVVTYLDETRQVFRHLFFLNPNVSLDSALYTKNGLYNQINFTAYQYENIKDISLGSYGHTCGETSLDCPLKLCVHKYPNSTLIPSKLFYDIPNTNPIRLCRNITTVQSRSMSEFITKNDIPDNFFSILSVDLRLSLQTIKLEQLRFGNSPQCVKFDIKLRFKNVKHTGKLLAEMDTDRQYLTCNSEHKMEDQLDYGEVVYDAIVILVCFWSFVLTTRSFIRNFRLAVFTFKFFKINKNQKLSILSDGSELVNMWFLIILLTDILTIVGSFIKIYIDISNLKRKNNGCFLGSLFLVAIATILIEDSYFYDVCSLCLGIAVLFIWIGILRYLGFLNKYNVLLITLQASFPSVLRFLSCAGILYFGFMFCGWIVLGPYHPKFSTLSEVSECLYSLINGDDMFMTFREMQPDNKVLWIFSKVYLYLFISLFIYVVLSLFIAIISDSYERLQSNEHTLCSKVKRFIHGPECRCYSEMTPSLDTRRSRANSNHNP